MGLEAISRGASQVLMVEQDRRIYGFLQQNVDALGCLDQADLLKGDALASVALLRAPRPLDVVFMDPPFSMMRDQVTRQRILDQLSRLSDLLSDDALVLLRTPLDAHETPHEVATLSGPEIRTYGRHHQELIYAPLQSEVES